MLLPLLLLLLLLIVVLATASCVVWHSSHWWRRGVAGPCGRPLVGNMLQFALGLRSYGDIYAELYNAYPTLRYVGFYRLFNEPALIVRDQQLLRELLLGTNFPHCEDNAVFLDVRRDPQAAQNPFLARGQHWRQRRGELLPLFTPHRLRQTLPHIAAACGQLQRFVARRLSRDCFEAKTLATRYTLQVIASAVFGLDAQCLGGEQQQGNCAAEKEEEEVPSAWLTLMGPLFQANGAWSLAETIALLHSPLLGWLLQHRYVPLTVQRWLHRQVAARSESNTLLSWLRGQADADIEGHAATLLLEGYETSAMLLAFALYELAQHPVEQRRLQAELDEVAQSNAGELLQPAALDALQYVEATLYETLRLHPAMPALLKRCTQSFTLPAQSNVNVLNGGAASLRVPKNTVLIVPVQAIHLDPALYEQPLSFQPERFMQQAPQGCRFLGFGAGARMCPGLRLGLAQTKAALASLLRDYNVLLANPKQPKVKKSTLTFLTACEGGIWLRLQRRERL